MAFLFVTLIGIFGITLISQGFRGFGHLGLLVSSYSFDDDDDQPMWSGHGYPIRTACTSCGTVELEAAEITVRQNASTKQNSHFFRCPKCHLFTASNVTQAEAHDLVANGSRLEVWPEPLERFEYYPSGDPFAPDDLLDFHLILKVEGDGWYRIVEEMVMRSRKRQSSTEG